MYVVLWEFVTRVGAERAFEELYGPDGRWAALFRRAPGYLGTELLRAADGSRRYLTVDRWRSAAEYDACRAASRAQYAALDTQGEALTEAERALGAFTTDPAADIRDP